MTDTIKINRQSTVNILDEAVSKLDKIEAKLTALKAVKEEIRQELTEELTDFVMAYAMEHHSDGKINKITSPDEYQKSLAEYLKNLTQEFECRLADTTKLSFRMVQGKIDFQTEDAVKWLKANDLKALIETIEIVPLEKWEGAVKLKLIPEDVNTTILNRADSKRTLYIYPSKDRKLKRAEIEKKTIDKFKQ